MNRFYFWNWNLNGFFAGILLLIFIVQLNFPESFHVFLFYIFFADICWSKRLVIFVVNLCGIVLDCNIPSNRDSTFSRVSWFYHYWNWFSIDKFQIGKIKFLLFIDTLARIALLWFFFRLRGWIHLLGFEFEILNFDLHGCDLKIVGRKTFQKFQIFQSFV